jgi:predicted phage terminase large subunit-like protein
MLSRSESIALDRILAKRSYHAFVQVAWNEFDPKPFVDNWHIKLLCDEIESMVRGKSPEDGALINVPPGFGKSMLSSVFLVPWLWAAVDPAYSVLNTTYSAEFSFRDSRKSRDIIASAWYQERWGDRVKLKQDAVTKYTNTAGGWRLATSVEGQGTGEHPRLIVADDLHKARSANSQADKANVIDYWDGTISTRGLIHGSKRLVIGQRISQGDIFDHLRAQGGYRLVSLPMESLPDDRHPNDPRTGNGELLWPEVFTPDMVSGLKLRLGSRSAAQLQQRPAPASGIVFDSRKFNYFTVDDGRVLLRYRSGRETKAFRFDECYWFQTVDTALKVKARNDYTVISTFGITPENDLLVYDVNRLKIEVPGQYSLIRAQKVKYPFLAAQHVEDKASGTGLIQQGAVDGLTLKAIPKGSQDKVENCQSFATMIENEKAFFNSAGPWLGEFETELIHFPDGVHDDQVDTCGDAAHVLEERAAQRCGVPEINFDNVKAMAERMRAKIFAASQQQRAKLFPPKVDTPAA